MLTHLCCLMKECCKIKPLYSVLMSVWLVIIPPVPVRAACHPVSRGYIEDPAIKHQLVCYIPLRQVFPQVY